MTKILVASLEGGIRHAFGLSDDFLKHCPDAVWGKKFGGWPVWQQFFHAFSALDFFLRGATDESEAPLFAPGVSELKHSLPTPPAKAQIKDYVEKAQTRTLRYVAGLDDAALAEKNEGLSARMGRDMTHAATLALIASHTMYHLGACDAALREQGLPGVF